MNSHIFKNRVLSLWFLMFSCFLFLHGGEEYALAGMDGEYVEGLRTDGYPDPKEYEKLILVDLSRQKLLYYREGKVVFASKISSGRVGHETPTGEFEILAKEANHRSNLYPVKADGTRGGAPMPYMMRVTKDGVAIHGGKVPGYPNSHGCIRLPYRKAAKLYKLVSTGTAVVIAGYPEYKDRFNRMRAKMLEEKLGSSDASSESEDPFNPYYFEEQLAGERHVRENERDTEKDLLYLDTL